MTWRRRYLLASVLLSFLAANVAGACASPPDPVAVSSAVVSADRSDRDATIPTPAPEPAATDPTTAPALQAPPAPLPPATAPLRPPTNPPPPAYRWRVVGPGVDVGIAGTVGAPCQGYRPVPWAGAYFDGCAAGTWIMAHPRFFGAMNLWSIGTLVTYFDGDGVAHVYSVTSSAVYPPGSSAAAVPAGALHLQVCTDNTTASPVRVLSAS